MAAYQRVTRCLRYYGIAKQSQSMKEVSLSLKLVLELGMFNGMDKDEGICIHCKWWTPYFIDYDIGIESGYVQCMNVVGCASRVDSFVAVVCKKEKESVSSAVEYES